MKTPLRLAPFVVVLCLTTPSTRAADPVDCNCVTNLPALTATCPAGAPQLARPARGLCAAFRSPVNAPSPTAATPHTPDPPAP